MRLRWMFLATALASPSLIAQDKPLTALPFTPVLDTRFMDKTADPCVDFYKYSCGNWNKLNPIPPDQSRWDVYSKLTNDNFRFLWGILEDAAAARSRTPNEQKIGDFFHACMDEKAIESGGADPIRPALDRIAALTSNRDIAGFVAEEHVKGNTHTMLFGFGSGQDYDNSSHQIAFAEAGGLGLPDRDYYTKTDAKSVETRTRYMAHVEKMFELLSEPAGQAKTDAAAVMQIETALATASLTRVEKRDPYNLKHKLPRAQLSTIAPAFDWDAYLKVLNPPSFAEVNVTEPKFFSTLSDELTQVSLAKWQAYLRWHLVHAEATYLSSPFLNENFAFYGNYLRGAKEPPPRWKKCTSLVDHSLDDALGQVFVERTFSPATKQDALRMTEQIEAAMESEIRNLNWMSEPTKQKALEKLHAIVNKIGYPDHWRDYSSVVIKPGDFVGNVYRAQEFEFRRDLNKIGKPVDRTEWFIPAPTVNAYYDPQMNDINFPAGVLEPPLFDSKEDDATNYGNTGATIGHELTHGFDDEGRQFDAQGNLKDWWTDADAKAFEDRVNCVRDQYAQYTIIDDIKINSKLTLGEDVADIGGTLLAYLAWKHAEEGKELKPIEDLTPDQRFFVGMAQWACGDERPEAKRVSAITDPHSPNEYRINGVVSDLPQFGEAFACKAGQPMVSEKACRVW
ncbi:MAG TPA: M13 family metallopeptidase [Bryobacteraceae bacterium]|jgi:endothelin-converting enzyme/putative endopeptidase|nr:M13 family metallopeptidase [Bryobacteraceae bacterium]